MRLYIRPEGITCWNAKTAHNAAKTSLLWRLRNVTCCGMHDNLEYLICIVLGITVLSGHHHIWRYSLFIVPSTCSNTCFHGDPS